jgi:GDP-mannose pyrophosphatase NudK
MNEKVKITDTQILSDKHFVLSEYNFEYRNNDGTIHHHSREIFNKGNAATILPYNPTSGNVVLIRQFRLPVYLNERDGGMLLEACAGIIEPNETPENCIIRETKEETGYELASVKKVFEAFMSPGSVTELVHFFVGEYYDNMRLYEGGGSDAEEDIEVLELPFAKAYEMIGRGEIKDGKTIMLLQFARIHRLLG